LSGSEIREQGCANGCSPRISLPLNAGYLLDDDAVEDAMVGI
jgi:hypothetical protein